MGALTNFRELVVWQKGHSLVLNVYKVTNSFPRSEQFGLTNQLRRASVSITSNIAEGFSRQSIKEKIQFYYVAHGSLSEVENQTQIAFDLSYISENEYRNLLSQAQTVGKLLNSLISSTKFRE